MQISENLGGTNEMGLKIAVPCIYSLRPFEEEETGARAMIRLDQSHSYTVGIRDQGWNVHRKRVDPLSVDRKHMSNQICSSFRTIY